MVAQSLYFLFLLCFPGKHLPLTVTFLVEGKWDTSLLSQVFVSLLQEFLPSSCSSCFPTSVGPHLVWCCDMSITIRQLRQFLHCLTVKTFFAMIQAVYAIPGTSVAFSLGNKILPPTCKLKLLARPVIDAKRMGSGTNKNSGFLGGLEVDPYLASLSFLKDH